MKTRTIRRIGKFFLAWQLAFSLTNCGTEFDGLMSSESSGAGSPNAETIQSPVIGEEISQLALSTNTPVTIPTSDQDGAVLMVVSQASDGGFHGFEIRPQAPDQSPPAIVLNTSRLSLDANDESEATAFLHQELRRAERDFTIEDTAKPVPHDLKWLSTENKRDFKVIRDFTNTSDYSIVTAQMIHSGEHFDLYADERDLAKLDPDNLNHLIANYETVLPLELGLLGQASDIDGTGKFTILFTREINAMAIRYGGLVTGFFYAIDLMDDKKYPASNEMEIFYVMVPDPEAEFTPAVPESLAWDIIAGVFVHELQHMINFNERFFVRGLPPEEGWLNEALSHFMEDIYDFSEAGPENPSRVGRYLDNPANICIVCGTTLEERGGSYLLLRYLYEQAEQGELYAVENGQDLIRRFLDSNERGIKNLKESAFGHPDADLDWREFLAQFGLATYFAGSDLMEDLQLDFLGLDLRGLQNDGRGTYLSGPALISPATLPFSHVMQGNSIAYFYLPLELLERHDGQFQIILNAPEDFQVFVIK